MNRRNFLKFLGVASVGATVAYSFPNIIVPKNIVTPYEVGIDPALGTDYSAINIITKKEIYPELIRDFWFEESPFFMRLKELTDDKVVYEIENQIKVYHYNVRSSNNF